MTFDREHIRYLSNGHYWFRSYSGSLLKSAKVTKTLLPQHSVPRLGSACPHSGLNPWAAAMGHPWPSAANPASCRVTHGFKPAFGHTEPKRGAECWGKSPLVDLFPQNVRHEASVKQFASVALRSH